MTIAVSPYGVLGLPEDAGYDLARQRYEQLALALTQRMACDPASGKMQWQRLQWAASRIFPHQSGGCLITVTPSEAAAGGMKPVRVRWRETCHRCRGKQKVGAAMCHVCEGNGFNELSRTVRVTIPPGTTSWTVLRIPDQGPPDKSQKTHQARDLLVTVQVMEAAEDVAGNFKSL